MTRLSPKQKRSKFRMDSLLDTAAILIVEQGAGGMALSHIAKRAGISQGSLYQYFGSREDVLEALHLRYIQQVLDILSELEMEAGTFEPSTSLEKLAQSIVRHFSPFYVANPGYAELRRHFSTFVQTNEDSLDRQIVERVSNLLMQLVPHADPATAKTCTEIMLEITDALLMHVKEHPQWKEEAKEALHGYLQLKLGRQ